MGYPKRTMVRSSLLAGQRNGQLSSNILTTYAGTSSGMPTVTLLKPAARGFRALRALALQHGITLDASGPSDSFRPLSVQQQIFSQRYTTTYTGIGCKTCGGRRYCKRSSAYATAACPSTSNHGWACAIDIRNAYRARLDFLLRYALSYGFCWELDSEPWHLVWYPGDQIPQPVLAYEKALFHTTVQQAGGADLVIRHQNDVHKLIVAGGLFFRAHDNAIVTTQNCPIIEVNDETFEDIARETSKRGVLVGD